MIRLDNVSKQLGHQILFIEASAALLRGEKAGLVGPNGAGKTTLFRMITGQDLPDEGQVAVDRGVSVGYFSQDVGEMRDKSAVAEVMDGAGPVSSVATELKALEAAMTDPDRADDMMKIFRALWRGAGALRGIGRLCARSAGARGLERARLQPGDDGGRCRRAVRRLEDARGVGAHPAHASRRGRRRTSRATTSISKA